MSRLRKHTGRPFRFPFDIDRRVFIVLAAIFFILSIESVNQLIFPRITPAEISHRIQKYYKNQHKDFENALAELSPEELKKCAFSHEHIHDFNTKSWTLCIYKNDTLCAWTKATNNPRVSSMQPNKTYAYFSENEIGLLTKKIIRRGKETVSVVGTFPMYIRYEAENNYFHSYFTFSGYAGASPDDFGFELATLPTDRLVNIKKIIAINGQPTFQLIEKEDFLDASDKNFWRFFLVAIPFVLFGVSFHTYLKVSVKRNPALYFSILLCIVAAVRLSTYYFDFPDSYTDFYLFNPGLYGGQGINFSLGDVFINSCLLFWIFFFYIMNVQNKVFNIEKKYYGWLFLVGMSALFLIVRYHLLCNIKSIVYDSTIDFDTTHWYNITPFTIIGLGTLLLCFMNFVFAAIILHRYFEKYAARSWWIYIVPIVSIVLAELYAPPNIKDAVVYIALWAILLFYLLKLRSLHTKFDFNSYKLVVWLIFFALSCVLLIYHFDARKEILMRENVARNILHFENKQIENSLLQLGANLNKDTLILNENATEDAITAHLHKEYLTAFSRQYQVKATIEPKDKQIIDISENEDVYYVQNSSGQNDSSSNLYLINYPGQEEYILSTPIGSRQVVISLQSAYPELKNENNILSTFQFAPSDNYHFANYKLAFYANGILVEQIGDGNFPSVLSKKLINTEGLLARNYHCSDVIAHATSNDLKKSIIIRRETNTFYKISTTYAYVFTSIFFLVTLYILGNVIARSNLRRKRFRNLLGLTLRMRIHLSILLVELISLVIIGFVTIYIFTNSARQRAVENATLASTDIRRAIHANLNFDGLSPINNDSITTKELKQVVEPYLAKHTVELLVYNKQGRRVFSTVTPVVKGIIPKYINPLALSELESRANSAVLKTENLGYLSYYTTYAYLKNRRNKIIGILEIPSFSSQQIIRQSDADIITMLINIYAFVYLLSALFSFYITKRLTNSFSKIVNQFSKINLTQTNTPLSWPYSDEIGLLIKEYNRTLRKLENSTALLAKTERELAWREMAKQIAHEIKNPLTPMSLSLQSLQMAIKRNDPNVPELTEKMTTTVLEQIKVLSRIASNFSEFARMIDIDARKESLIDILESTTGIYSDTEETEYLFVLPKHDIFLFVDKVKIIRVITNVIQNAVQAIPADRTGKISLTVSREADNIVKITISDNGDGIPEELADRVFEPNFTTKYFGSGLGLAMCKDIMLKSGGNIYFETEEGVGTKFHIEIPEYNEAEDEE